MFVELLSYSFVMLVFLVVVFVGMSLVMVIMVFLEGKMNSLSMVFELDNKVVFFDFFIVVFVIVMVFMFYFNGENILVFYSS